MITKKEILELLKNGNVIIAVFTVKFKGNKLIRGTFMDYSINSIKIRSSQFDSLKDKLEKVKELSCISITVYKIKE